MHNFTLEMCSYFNLSITSFISFCLEIEPIYSYTFFFIKRIKFHLLHLVTSGLLGLKVAAGDFNFRLNHETASWLIWEFFYFS